MLYRQAKSVLLAVFIVKVFIVFGNLFYKGIYRLNCISAFWKVIYIEYSSNIYLYEEYSPIPLHAYENKAHP